MNWCSFYKKFLGVWLVSFYFATPVVADVDKSPWFKPIYEIYPKLEICWQNYQRISTPDWRCHCGSRDFFADASAQVTMAESWDVGAEFRALKTSRHALSASDICLSLRYQLADDILGDYFSLVTGATGRYAFFLARRNLSVFEPGAWGGEVHIAAGREWSSESWWLARMWLYGSVGFADEGSPWGKAMAVAEVNYFDKYRAAILLTGSKGFGSHHLCLYHFRGYGAVNYAIIDLGIRLEWYFEDGSYVDSRYEYRLFARDAPYRVNQVTLGYTYPFGL